MKIMFLDDDPTRTKFVQENNIGADITYTTTAEQAMRVLAAAKFDLALLDHDLGGQHYVASGKGTGYEVAAFIVTDLPKDRRPTKVIVHSYNPAGAANMVAELSGAGMDVMWRPFGKWLVGISSNG